MVCLASLSPILLTRASRPWDCDIVIGGPAVEEEDELKRFLQYSAEELKEAVEENQKTRTTANRNLDAELSDVHKVENELN